MTNSRGGRKSLPNKKKNAVEKHSNNIFIAQSAWISWGKNQLNNYINV